MSLIITLGARVSSGADQTSRSLPRSAPEAQGVSSAALLDFINDADAKLDGMHGFMLVRHGHVIAEGWWAPYSASSRHSLFSLSKSFTSTAVGLAINEGKLSLDDEVMKFFPDDVPEKPSDNLKAMRVRDLLMMSSGHHTADIENFPYEQEKVNLPKLFLALPVPHKPGTHFMYNTPGSYMLSAIVQKATGQKVLDYLRPRLFEPLGIDDPQWAESKAGVSLGGYGLAVRTEDIAKFGLLYLNRGKWNGQTLVPESWVEQATMRQTSNGSIPTSDWDQGYGFQFWRCRHNCYRGDGAFGQYCIVIPEHDAVIAINAGTRDMGAVMNLIWEKLFPAFGRDALPVDEGNAAKLKSKLASLGTPMPRGDATSSRGGNIGGRSFVLPKNDQHIEAVALEPGQQADTLILRINDREHRVRIGHGRWERGKASFAREVELRLVDAGEEPIAAAGAWTSENTYAAKLCFSESPLTLTMNLKFGSDFVVLDVEHSVSFGPTTKPTIVGQAK
jgi:CubicO group peptidase (beta-lactamase class C family)